MPYLSAKGRKFVQLAARTSTLDPSCWRLLWKALSPGMRIPSISGARAELRSRSRYHVARDEILAGEPKA